MASFLHHCNYYSPAGHPAPRGHCPRSLAKLRMSFPVLSRSSVCPSSVSFNASSAKGLHFLALCCNLISYFLPAGFIYVLMTQSRLEHLQKVLADPSRLGWVPFSPTATAPWTLALCVSTCEIFAMYYLCLFWPPELCPPWVQAFSFPTPTSVHTACVL